ncbi:MAG TPA: hypothetical protein VK604_18605 [Bryobacteraceae bacterium]|nr:hypothetical protein [Bryobacteraceae bacterium]
MKIGNSGIESLIQSGTGSVTGAGSETHPAAAPPGGGARSDSVTLSNGRNLVALARASLANTNTAKVRSIASQISTGQYLADSMQTSQAVVEGHLRA